MPLAFEPEEGRCADERGAEMSREQLEGIARGVAGVIMATDEGWKLQYVSDLELAAAPGTLFGTFDEAVSALASVLPQINSPAERERARRELAERWPDDECDESPPE